MQFLRKPGSDQKLILENQLLNLSDTHVISGRGRVSTTSSMSTGMWFFLLLKWTSVNVFFLVSNSTKTPRKGFYVQLPRFDVVALRVRLHPIEFHSIWKWRAGEICFSTETTFPHITFTFQLRSKLDIQDSVSLKPRGDSKENALRAFLCTFLFQAVCLSLGLLVHSVCYLSFSLISFVSSLVYFFYCLIIYKSLSV